MTAASGPLPTVSIVVMNHNYGRYLSGALTSAFLQEPGSYQLVEIVIVDDGSTDNSDEIIRRFPRARVVRKSHEGFAATLTRAVEESRGDWFAPLDADDAFTVDKLRTLAPYLAQPDLQLVQHAEYVVDAEGLPFAEGTHPGGSTSTLLVRGVVARDLLPVTNELFFHVLTNLGQGLCLSDSLTYYRVHNESMTDRRTPGAFADYLSGVCEELVVRLERLSASPPVWATGDQLAHLADTYREQAETHRESARYQRHDAAPDQLRKEQCR